MAPLPHEQWEGIRDATSEGNISPQIDFFFQSFTGDENCLFLNVYTPKLDRSFLPVMFYIPGGGLLNGSGNTDLYGPDYLVEKDVVVVTINYRLGALGFLCLNTPEVPGNAGLKDIVLALRWVKENIHNFGGNAGNITIFGESSGGRIVSVLTASPLTKSLIHKAIIQSGTALLSWSIQNYPIDSAKNLAKTLGFEAESVDEILKVLSAIPAKDMVEALASMTSKDNVLGKIPNLFGIVAEEEFPGVEAVINEPISDLLETGRMARVPIMIGSTTLEFAFEKKSDDLQLIIPEELNLEKDSETSLAIIEELKKLYFKGSEETLFEYYQLLSDKFVNVDTHRYVQYLLQSSDKHVYVYKFDYVGELNITKKRSNGIIQNQPMHVDDLGYLFKNILQDGVEPTSEDLKMKERMVRLWTNFAKTGNPTPDKDHFINVTWLPAVQFDEHYLHLAQELSLGSNFDKEKMEFWDSLYQKYYKSCDQPQPHTFETPNSQPVIIKTLKPKMTNSSEVTHSSETEEMECVTTETMSEMVETSSDMVEIPGEMVETPSNGNETNFKLVETVGKMFDGLIITKRSPNVEERNNDEKRQFYGNIREKTVKGTSSEIQNVTNSNGVPKDVIRANDPPEDDLPKNIGVNKFVNFFESLGGNK